jgi:hypothetical protein
MTEPNALDRLFNAVVSDREVKKMVRAKADALVQEALLFRLPEASARGAVRSQLKQWIQGKGFTGRGTKKLVDKTLSRAMSGYRRSLHNREEGLEEDPSDDTKVRLLDGWADRESRKREPGWQRRYSAMRGQRAAEAFKQKHR